MATTFTLKRKYFADPNQQQGEQKKGMSTGKKLAIAGGALAVGATALGAYGAGGLGKLASNFTKGGAGFKGVASNIASGAGKVTKNVGASVQKAGLNLQKSKPEGFLNTVGNTMTNAGRTVKQAGAKII